MYNRDEIGKRIKAARLEKHLSQIKFAELINVSTPYLSDIAMSKTPHTQYLCMFARHGNLFYHSKFIVTTSSKWYN